VLRLKGAAEVDSLQAGMGFFIRLLLNPNRLLSKQPEQLRIFIDMIHVAEGLDPMLCSENGRLVPCKSCGASGYGSFSSYPPSLISPFMQLEG
jgi:hypothetical protein